MNKIRAVIFDLYGTLIRMDNNRSYFNFMSEVVLEREQKKE